MGIKAKELRKQTRRKAGGNMQREEDMIRR